MSSWRSGRFSKFDAKTNLPGGGERQVDGREEEVRYCEADDEGGGGVGAQLGAPQQGHHCQQVPCTYQQAQRIMFESLTLNVYKRENF
jgi:hypothetical protein